MHRPQDYDAVLIALADQPFLTAQDISDYAQSYLASSRDKIFIPYYQAQRGNPLITTPPSPIITPFQTCILPLILTPPKRRAI